MTEQAPFARLGSVIFAYTACGWLAFRLIRHLWHPGWYGPVGDIAAAVSFMAALTDRILRRWAELSASGRLAHVENRIRGYDAAMAQFFPDPVTLRAVPGDPPDGSPPATGGSRSGAALLAFRRRGDSR